MNCIYFVTVLNDFCLQISVVAQERVTNENANTDI